MRKCRSCGVSKALDDFYRDKRSLLGHKGQCKACACAEDRARRASDGGRTTTRQRASRLKRYFGITPEQYDEMLAAQGGTCAICDTDQPGGTGAWAVDHDHACCPGKKTCGKCLRGLLCFGCNAALGCFADDIERLASAARYLEAWA